MILCRCLSSLFLVVLLLAAGSFDALLPGGPALFAEGKNWAMVVGASRYWHNYRHTSNALGLYHMLRSSGMPDERIVLFLAEKHACDSRNPFPGTVFNNKFRYTNYFGCHIVTSASGYEAHPSLMSKVMQARFSETTAPQRRWLSDNESNIVLYLNGHGNKGMLKFHDLYMFSDEDISDTIAMMHQFGMYKRMLILADTCNAESMCLKIRTPNVVCIASSTYDENSYSHHGDDDLGLEVVDNFIQELNELLFSIPIEDRIHYRQRDIRHHSFNDKSEILLDGKRMQEVDLKYDPSGDKDGIEGRGQHQYRATRPFNRAFLNKTIGEIFNNFKLSDLAVIPAMNDPEGSMRWRLNDFFSGDESVFVEDGWYTTKQTSQEAQRRAEDKMILSLSEEYL